MKEVLKLLFQPWIDIFEDLKDGWEGAKEIFLWTIKLWLLTSVIPIVCTVMFIFVFIIGGTLDKLFTVLYDLWSGYYVTGTLLVFEAWKIHLGLLFLSLIINIANHFDE